MSLPPSQTLDVADTGLNLSDIEGSPSTSRNEPASTSEPHVFGRVTGQDIADLRRELRQGERSSLSVSEGLKLLEELYWLRRQLQRIRVIEGAPRHQELAHEALYGERVSVDIRVI